MDGRFLLKLINACLLCLGVAHADPGVDWLSAQSNQDGSYARADDVATPYQATSESLRTFTALGLSASPRVPAARAFVQAQTHKSTETLARKIIVRADAGLDAARLVSALSGLQNPDGGFGELTGYDSTVLDTALALDALSSAGKLSSPAAGRALGFLVGRQHADGGWSAGDDSHSVYVSALALRALWLSRRAYSLAAAIQHGREFLLDQRDGAGLWAEPFESAHALIAVLPTQIDRAPVIGSVQALRALQLADGSFGQDVYVTALALRALALAAKPSPDDSSITGRVIDGDTGLALAGATVAIAGSSPRSVSTSPDGGFAFSRLVPGRYQLDISLTGYSDISATTDIEIGQAIDFGNLRLLKGRETPSTGTVRGVIVDADSGQPLPGARVSVTGGSDAAVSDSNGVYQLSNVPPGDITVSATKAGFSSAEGTAVLQAGQLLVFSPELARSGDVAATALQGTVTGADGAPLSGVKITISGSSSASAATNEQGRYRIEGLTPGVISALASLAGFEAVAAKATIVENNTVRFSPILYPDGAVPDDVNTATVTGTVLDSTTSQPLAGVLITTVSNGQSESASSDNSGQFTAIGLTGGDVKLAFLLDGYLPLQISVPLQPLASVNLGHVRLRPEGIEDLLPDLVIRRNDVRVETTMDSQTLRVAGTVSVTIENAGTAPAPDGVELLSFYDADFDDAYDADIDILLARTKTVSDLGVSATQTLEIPVKGRLPFRDAPLKVLVDSAKRVVETDERNNVGTSASLCRAEPLPDSTLEPVLKWHWSREKVLTIPLVGPLVDTNDDALIDGNDDPAVIFGSHTGFVDHSRATLRAINGKTGQQIWSVTDPALRTEGSAHPALGDIDGDGKPEVVMYLHSGGIAAINNDGSLKWSTNLPGRVSYYNYGAISLADIDRDGKAEILARNHVFNHDGTLRWSAPVQVWNAIYAIAVDLNKDGNQEVVVGGPAFDAAGNAYWNNQDVPKGLTAAGNFDNDDLPELVVVRSGRAYLIDDNGSSLWSASIPGGGGGAPTIADTDGDGLAEIGVAGRSNYVVFNHDGSILWTKRSRDFSSRTTGSTVFDFNGDGQSEVVYADEVRLRVFDGTNGNVIFEIANGSATATEYPVIADLDGDNHAELLVVSDRSTSSARFGLRAFENRDDNWVPTRGIWNQYAYHIDNIADDGTIPRLEKPSWLSHNTYRLNTFADVHPLDSADLTASLLEVIDQGAGRSLSLRLRVGNAGLIPSPTGITLSFYEGDPAAGGSQVGSLHLDAIAPGGYRDVQLDDVTGLSGARDIYGVVDRVDTLSECDETNNVVNVPFEAANALGLLTVATDAPVYGPGSSAKLAASVTNTGSLAGDFELELQIEDEAGIVIRRFEPIGLAGIPGGTVAPIEQDWSIGTVLAGAYALRGVLRSTNGALLDETSATFEIRHPENVGPAVSLRTTTNKSTYHTSDVVQIGNLARNLTASTVVPAASVRVRVLDPAGREVYEHQLALGELVPGARRHAPLLYLFEDAPEGRYRVRGVLLDAAGKTLASDAARYFVEEDLRMALVGEVTVQASALDQGETQVCTDTLTNQGSLEIANRPIRQLVVRLDDAAQILSTPTVLDLAVGASRELVRNVATDELEVGDYACVLQARIDNEWHPLADAVFQVNEPPIEIDTSLYVGELGRLLILLDDPGRRGDPHGPDGVPELSAQRDFLEALLERQGWSYAITTEAEDFARELRTGGYSVYALFNERIKLAEQVQKELREAVFRGEGLVRAGSHDQRNGRLDEALGIKYKGKRPRIDGLALVPSDIHEGGQAAFVVGERVSRVELDGADAVGYIAYASRPPVPMVTRYDYGDGTSVHVGFDLLAQASIAGESSLLADLLAGTLMHVHPDKVTPVASGVLPMRLTLTNQGLATPGRALITPPGGASVADPGEARSSPAKMIDWPFELARDETEHLDFWLRLPDVPVPVTVEALVQTGVAPGYVDHASTELLLTPRIKPGLSQALAELGALQGDKRYRQARHQLRRGEQALHKGRFVKALKALVKTADALIRIDSERAAEIRRFVAHAIRQVSAELVWHGPVAGAGRPGGSLSDA